VYQLIKKILFSLNALLVILTVGAYLAPHISAEASAIFPILGLGYPALLLANILMVLLWAIVEKKKAWLSFLILVVGYNSCSKLINFNLADDESDGTILLASYNSNFLKPIAFLPEGQQAKASEAFETYIGTLGMDVLCVQEHGWRSARHLKSALGFDHVHSVEGKNVAIYSRYPFLDTGILDFDSNVANTCLWADVITDTDIFRVYTTHLESNRDDGIVPEVIEQEAPEKMNNAALLGIVKHFREFSARRVQQARMIQAHKRTAPYPSVICGDFNDTPQSHVYQVVGQDMKDSFLEAGSGIGSTFGERIPALRIDYIFTDQAIDVSDHLISKNNFSDHYMILATIELP